MLESTQKKSIITERAAQSADELSHDRRGLGAFTFLPYLTVIVCFFVLGALLWRLQIETEKDLDTIKSNLYSMAVSTSIIQKKLITLEQFVIKNSASNTLIKSRLDGLSESNTLIKNRLDELSEMRNRRPTSEKPPIYYEVAPGDNLFRIAEKYGVSVKHIAVINNLTDKDQIYVGQRILITKGDGDDPSK